MLRTRLAPTPSGYLHSGNGISFIVTWAIARAAGGKVVLRIDDLDKGRRRPEYLEDIFRTLEWLGLDYDEGPTGPEDFLSKYSQHHRLGLYYEVLHRLRESGYLYACTCSRRQIRERSTDGRYPNTCRTLQLPFDKTQTAWRISVPESTTAEFREWRQEQAMIDIGKVMGDFVVRQKNRLPAYQIGSLVDDLHYNINFVVRGKDLRPSTAAQAFLASILQEQAFLNATFWHHPLISNMAGEKLSKSKGAGSLAAWRNAGRSPEPLYQEAAKWLFEADQVNGSLEALVERIREKFVPSSSGWL